MERLFLWPSAFIKACPKSCRNFVSVNMSLLFSLSNKELMYKIMNGSNFVEYPMVEFNIDDRLFYTGAIESSEHVSSNRTATHNLCMTCRVWPLTLIDGHVLIN